MSNLTMNQMLRFGAVDTILNMVMNNGKGNNGSCSFVPSLRVIEQIVTEQLLKSGFRCTIELNKVQGSPNQMSKLYDGLLGQLQRHEIDWIAGPVSYPLLTNDEEEFIYPAVIFDDALVIMSYYEMNHDQHYSSVLGMFKSIPSMVWIGYVTSLIIFVTISFIGSIVSGQRMSSLWNAICEFVNQNNCSNNSSMFQRSVSWLTCVAMFFLMAYATNSMGTDLITVDDPVVIDSYDDIIDGNITNLMVIGSADWQILSSAPEGSIESKLLKQSAESRPAHDFNLYKDQKAVSIARPIVARTLAYGTIHNKWNGFDRNLGRILIAVDGQADRTSTGFVLTRRMKGTQFELIMIKISQRLLEHGFPVLYSRSWPERAMEAVTEMSMALWEKQLVSNHVEKVSGQTGDIEWIHFQSTTVLLIIGYGIGLIIVIIEMVMDKVQMVIERRKQPFGGRIYRRNRRLERRARARNQQPNE